MKCENKYDYLQEQSPLGLKGIDYVEFYVGNVAQATHFYRSAFGFTPVAYAGLETGESNFVSYLLRQNNIKLLLTSPLNSHGPLAEHVRLHGDGIKDVAFCVENATSAFERAVSRGARPVMEPVRFDGPGGQVIKATIETFGDTVHSFIERDDENGAFLPHFQPVKKPPATTTGISQIDHVAISLEKGKLDYWVEFYKNVLGFRISHKEDVMTEYSGMNSRVVESETGAIKFPMMEPAVGKRKSQIEEFLSYYGGPGAQHIAFLSENIIESVRVLQSNGVSFLSTPMSYYESLQGHVGQIEEDVASLREFNILVDRDEWGYLMQVFTLPLHGRPTLFAEVIQRKGALGFGGGNIKALFEAVEREQMKRGGF